MTTQLAFILLIVSLVVLTWSAERFIRGAAAFANNLGISSLIIGMALIGFGTSLPEMIVSAMAAINGNPDIGIGNAIGSNIVNVGLVAAVTAIYIPITVQSTMLKREYPILLVTMIFAFLVIFDGKLQRFEGVLLLIGFILVIAWLIFQASRPQPETDKLKVEFTAEIPKDMTTFYAVLWIVIGLVLLLVSSRTLVLSAVTIAKHFGVSDLVIGLTIVAVGTSLPELATAILSALKKEHELVMGNIIGSSIFNLLAVLAMPALFSPGKIPHELLHRDYPVMAIFLIVLMIMSYGFRRDRIGRINRLEGLILLLGFGIYVWWLF